MSELLKLAERVEALSHPLEDFDCAIREAIDPRYTVEKRVMYYGCPTGEHVTEEGYFSKGPEYTRSLDAAMTLVPPGSVWFVGNSDDPSPTVWNACVMPENAPADRWVRASSPALALCAAALRARAPLPVEAVQKGEG